MQDTHRSPLPADIAVLGAGPAGLTAGLEAVRVGFRPVVLEASSDIGGIARTFNYKGCLFDLGGHRFFTKFPEVERIWKDVLGGELLKRPRLSRIYYKRKFFYYPLKPLNALSNLGLLESGRVMISYLTARLRPFKAPSNFEKWVVNRFGRRLFEIFFKTYTEKVWGIPCGEIQADWAAQRIKSLSLGKAVLDSLGLGRKGSLTTLIDEFHYPRRGPGQMWAEMRKLIERQEGVVRTGAEVVRVKLEGSKVHSISVRTDGALEEIEAAHYISSLPLKALVDMLEPRPPDEVVRAARDLKYRGFLTVGLILRQHSLFPDNWIYIHDPEVLAGRMQNFKKWSPDMVPDPDLSTLGLEYFCNEGDSLWSRPDGELIALGLREAAELDFASPENFVDGVVLRSPKSYPVYDPGYKENIGTIRDYLSSITNLQTVGRNGLHRYNNMDHSMLTALYAVRNITGGSFRIWDVNVEDSYHEQS
jgi:protoporphyrinogen oxidase